MNSHELFIHIHQGCFAGTGAIVRLPQCQWSKPDGYGKISQCISTIKHSKAKTVCIFLGIYCISTMGSTKCIFSNMEVTNGSLLAKKTYEMNWIAIVSKGILPYITWCAKNMHARMLVFAVDTSVILNSPSLLDRPIEVYKILLLSSYNIPEVTNKNYERHLHRKVIFHGRMK